MFPECLAKIDHNKLCALKTMSAMTSQVTAPESSQPRLAPVAHAVDVIAIDDDASDECLVEEIIESKSADSKPPEVSCDRSSN